LPKEYFKVKGRVNISDFISSENFVFPVNSIHGRLCKLMYNKSQLSNIGVK
jgi:hypothetical protein